MREPRSEPVNLQTLKGVKGWGHRRVTEMR